VSNQSPFKFLDAYGKPDRGQFFGRDTEIEKLHELTFETNLILLYGASGTGKTSLINCGLANKFQDTDWFDMFIRRGSHMMESLEREIRGRAIKEIPPDWPMRRALKSLFYDYYKPIYLIFDQFEEIFILGDKEEQSQFFQFLSELMRMSLQLTVVLSMREEYIAFLADFEELIPSLFDHRFRVERMSRTNLEKVITGTCGFHNIELYPQDGVVDSIIENLRNSRGAVDLTNLQVYLDRLYRVDRQRRPNEPARFDPELIKEVGSLEDIMGEFLNEQIQVVEDELNDPSKKDIPLTVLFELVTENATKRSMEEGNIKQLLEKKGIAEADVDYCLKRFTDMRLIREVE